MLTKSLNAIIHELLLKKFGITDSELEIVSTPGSSLSRVFIFRNSKNLIAVKVSRNDIKRRVTLEDEVQNRKAILGLLPHHTAKVYWLGKYDNHDILIYECIGEATLHSEYMQRNIAANELRKIWRDVVQKITEMWVSSKVSTTVRTELARNYEQRLYRISEGLKSLPVGQSDATLFDYYYLPITVNGERTMSIAEMLDRFRAYKRPDFTVTCHGDPQPSNVVINPQNLEWNLIDWEWSGSGHDWRMMAAHLYGWWKTRTVSFTDTPQLKVSDSGIAIDYKLDDNNFTEEMAIVIKQLNEKFDLKSNEKDQEAFESFIALLLVGEIRFTHIWRRESHIPYLLGEALRTLRGGTIKYD